MGRVLRGDMLGHRESKCRQVEAGKQRFSLSESDRGKREVEGIYEAGAQILPHRGNTAADLHIFVARSLFREP